MRFLGSNHGHIILPVGGCVGNLPDVTDVYQLRKHTPRCALEYLTNCWLLFYNVLAAVLRPEIAGRFYEITDKRINCDSVIP